MFTLPHPITQFFISDFISGKWKEISKQLKTSKFSISVPKLAHPEEPRAVKITPLSDLHPIVHKRLGHLAYVARSDIQAFYPSLYTHSIPWVVHGKPASKKDTSPNSANVTFNKLDWCLRRGQDGQTIGIPIGPDTSRIIGELICSAIDGKLKSYAGKNLVRCVRHVDDVFMGADTRETAGNCIAAFRRALRDFGLEINEGKTRIFQASSLRDDDWPRKLLRRVNSYELEEKPERKRNKLFGLFEETFWLADSLQSEAPVRFLLRRMDRDGLIAIGPWDVSENFLIKCLYDYPHTTDHVSRILIWQELFGGEISKRTWRHALNNRLEYHLGMGHDEEIAWLLWAAVSLDFAIGVSSANLLASYENPIIALMSVHAYSEGVLPKKTKTSFWASKINDESLVEDWWLVAYECAQKGWLGTSPKWETPVGKLFATMKEKNVFFYRVGSDSLSDFDKDKPAIPSSSFGYEEEEDIDGTFEDEPF